MRTTEKPKAIELYTQNMGGVDRLDEFHVPPPPLEQIQNTLDYNVIVKNVAQLANRALRLVGPNIKNQIEWWRTSQVLLKCLIRC